MDGTDLEQLIGRAKHGDLDAFAEVTRRFQHMAFGYALSIVRDLQQAEDVVQEAFVAEWFGLLALADPTAFPGWFRGIVRHSAHRLVRQRQLEACPLAAAAAVAAEGSRPDDRLEQGQQVAAVLGAIARLPALLREVVTLFYVHDCTQQDIATFLGLPVMTVNNRLHAARTQRKRRTLTMVKDTLEAHWLPDDFAARIGRIVRSREGVVEVLFDPTRLPDPLTELTVSDEGRRRAVTVQVVQLLENGVVRCVPILPVEGVSPGMTVMSSGRRTQAPVSPEELVGAVRLLTKPVASATVDLSTQRAHKLLRFFAQPFFVAGPYTKQPGLYVSRADALRRCRAILSGECEAVPEQAFYFSGALDDVLRKARGG